MSQRELISRASPSAPRSFAAAFDPRANSLNAIRLLLALTVIVWHSFPLTGRDIEVWPLRQALAEVPVDGFFAISGFLIVSSWVRDPSWWRFLAARVLRIVPALWVCLAVISLVIAPTVMLLTSASPEFSMSNLTYIASNSGIWVFQKGIAGTLTDVPFPGVWDGSLWTLSWEFLCYLAVLALGLAGALRFRRASVILFVLTLIALLATAYGPIDNALVVTGARFAIMFATGALIYYWMPKLPLNARWLSVAGVCVAGSLFLPDYRALGAIPLAYLVLGWGTMMKAPRLRTDLSYGTYIYAFPVQQSLAAAGGAHWPLLVFMAASAALTLPFAAASWFLIEKPALRLRPRRGLHSGTHDRRMDATAVAGRPQEE